MNSGAEKLLRIAFLVCHTIRQFQFLKNRYLMGIDPDMASLFHDGVGYALALTSNSPNTFSMVNISTISGALNVD